MGEVIGPALEPRAFPHRMGEVHSGARTTPDGCGLRRGPCSTDRSTSCHVVHFEKVSEQGKLRADIYLPLTPINKIKIQRLSKCGRELRSSLYFL